jgi:hypothetical protein
VQVSRFTANAASLRTRDDIIRLLSTSLTPTSLKAVARQLMLSEDKAAEIVKKAERDRRPVETFTRLAMRDDLMTEIFSASKRIRQEPDRACPGRRAWNTAIRSR